MQFCGFPLNRFPWSSDGCKNEQTGLEGKKCWGPGSLTKSQWWYRSVVRKEININSEVFSLWLAQYTFCPAYSASSLPSRLNSWPVNTSFYFLFKLSVHISSLRNHQLLKATTLDLKSIWILLKNLLPYHPHGMKNFKSKQSKANCGITTRNSDLQGLSICSL